MICFDEQHYYKFQDSKITGTGYLAYRDIPQIISSYDVSLKKTLDLGCGSAIYKLFKTIIRNGIYNEHLQNMPLILLKKILLTRRS